jgi:hypothetical protein
MEKQNSRGAVQRRPLLSQPAVFGANHKVGNGHKIPATRIEHLAVERTTLQLVNLTEHYRIPTFAAFLS